MALWDKKKYIISSYSFVYLKGKSFQLRERDFEKQIIKIHSFLEKLTINRGKQLLHLQKQGSGAVSKP